MPSYSLYVFLIIVGCVVVTFIGYSVHYISTNGFSDDKYEPEMSDDQRRYLREVRFRNFLALEEACRAQGPPVRPRDRLGAVRY
ncbi:hypothetical protein N7466_000467 [Penicillium verhagenii]|uniref:uncharacterized protein n=1 Tax=Penicillium verhagenii TaxID=1562060 RepID=UPI002545578F|nr:uncharacterized protein N7466_000467 [Penicillium verhagenii]KAJ5947452.1 hypothetical protein N7466_000467 [Penicillium verhagenii]